MHSTERHKHILHLIPEAPKSISSKDLHDKFQENLGYISLRMLQRDLDYLFNSESNIIKSKKGKNNKWSFEQGTKLSQLMSPSVALAMNMLAQYANHLLPCSVNKQLQGHFNQAQRTLTCSKLTTWQLKIATAQAGFQLHKAEIDPEVLDIVEQAIIDQSQLKVVYQNRPTKLGHQIAAARLISPLGLVIKGNVYYLIASTPENQKRVFAMHRMSSAERSYNEVKFPTDFNLQEFMEKEGIGFPTHKIVNIKLKVDRIRGYHLIETPLCPQQQVIDFDDQYFIIKASLYESHELHWWLMSIADISEVIAPLSLRNKIIENLEIAIGMYK